MNATFSQIIITNITTQAVVKVLPFSAENENKADIIARTHNLTTPMLGMLSVYYK